MSDNSNQSSQQNSVKSGVSECNSAHSGVSFAPTLNGDEAPFEEFAWSVQQLCKRFWPTTFEDISITRHDGGSFNRIIGLSVRPSLALTQAIPPNPARNESQDERSEHYILRVSRSDDDIDIPNQVATLFYVQKHTSIPVPRVLAFDIGSDNDVEKPYTLQQRIPGVPLEGIIDKLTFNQRRGLAVQIARILRQMQDVRASAAGTIGIPTHLQFEYHTDDEECNKLRAKVPGDLSLEKKLAFMTVTGLPTTTSNAPESFDHAKPKIEDNEDLQILHFELRTNWPSKDPYNGVANTVKNTEIPVLTYFNFQFARQMLHILHRSIKDVCKTRMYHQLMQIALEMDDDRCLGKDAFNLCHGDLEPRNIMVHVCDFGDVHIAGVLDWDFACFAPQAASCLAPRWLWSYKPGIDSNEREDEDDPTDPEQIALKEAFDDAVGDAFTDMAYSPEGRIVRRLFSLSIGGIGTNEAFDEVENLVKDWAELRRSRKEDGSDSDDASAHEYASDKETSDNGDASDNYAASDKEDASEKEDVPNNKGSSGNDDASPKKASEDETPQLCEE